MTDNIEKEIQVGKPDKIEYEKPTVDTVSAQQEVYGVVSNCSMGQAETSCSEEE